MPLQSQDLFKNERLYQWIKHFVALAGPWCVVDETTFSTKHCDQSKQTQIVRSLDHNVTGYIWAINIGRISVFSPVSWWQNFSKQSKMPHVELTYNLCGETSDDFLSAAESAQCLRGSARLLRPQMILSMSGSQHDQHSILESALSALSAQCLRGSILH